MDIKAQGQLHLLIMIAQDFDYVATVSIMTIKKKQIVDRFWLFPISDLRPIWHYNPPNVKELPNQLLKSK